MKRILLPFLFGFFASVSFIAPANADQPRMEAALRDLRAAKESLDKAENNRGGHRARAIELVEQAIAEVKAGIAEAR